MKISWTIAALAALTGIAAWIAFTLPDIGTEHLTDEDWYDL
jgi:hypothetical protein